MSQIAYIDNLLKEYLVYRGFSNTLKALDVELRNERDQSFRAEKILEQFNHSINNHDLQALKTLWMHLDIHLFSKLEHSYAMAVKNLENSLLKLYLISAYNSGKHDKIAEFFNKLAADLQQQSEWKEWFYFPFCKNAEESPIFAHYFSKQWQDTFQLSLRNFLTTVYQCIPQPTFVRAEQEAALIRRLQEENANLKTRVQALQAQQQAQMAASSSTQNLLIAGAGTEMVNRRRSTPKSQLPHLSDITPFDISPPDHLADDFFNIATETNVVAQAGDAQARGLKLLIRNISSGSSPVMGRREAADKNSKRRSGSVGRNWI